MKLFISKNLFYILTFAMLLISTPFAFGNTRDDEIILRWCSATNIYYMFSLANLKPNTVCRTKNNRTICSKEYDQKIVKDCKKSLEMLGILKSGQDPRNMMSNILKNQAEEVKIRKKQSEEAERKKQLETNKTNNTVSKRETYWTPYMYNVEQQIKKNWHPLKNKSSYRVVVAFEISKDGNLKSKKVIQSSGKKEIDKSALEAIDKTVPFEPLPKEFTDNSVPIEYTFDYNVK